ncbi:MAG: undecaprenyl-diphosphatase UppP [Candidatus Moranbacteria bacterium RIFCSPHIGHO2_02_FULL_40_12b]|nr:MAG: undecaprenyl-diphosphatase UppP [Candidatus Moranbacteria bacterium RIFCSPHIGHO2_02_FULL_40_12b]OGI23440.1 MAG: undecaprenyl-diphosphatase UppP [Candidatus Moranbacteria bacterium RIFCSPHIGHO2_12_FULL_40_10]
MDIFQSIILGIAQGLGEFLPISSTAHLILLPKFFGWKDPGLSFDVALHAGTLVAVVSYFYKDWIMILKLAVQNKPTTNNLQLTTREYDRNILWLLVIATIPGVLAGYFLEEQAETIFRNPLVIAFTLAFAGLVLYLADKFLKHNKNIKNLNLKDSIIIGLLQALAIIPGVSRSGATIIGGLWKGLDREEAARFSFLLSTPIILGATVNQFPDFFRNGMDLKIILGILFSAVSGYLAIKYLLKFIHRVGYGVFFWYRLALAAVIAVIYLYK